MLMGLVLILILQAMNIVYGITGGRFDTPHCHRMKRDSPDESTRAEDLLMSLVSLRSREPKVYKGDNHFCSGTLISEIFVITAAHCVHSNEKVAFRPREIIVVAGLIETPDFPDSDDSIPVNTIIVHENFTLYNTPDIALLRLLRPVREYSKYIDIAEPGIDKPPFGATCQVLGYDRSYPNGPLAEKHLIANLVLYDLEKCNSTFSLFLPGMICAANTEDNTNVRSPCPGDTGGPLFCNNKLQGVISYTTGCGTTNFPTVFVNTYFYADWITDIVESVASLRHVHICLRSCLFLNLFTFAYNFFINLSF